jgi:4-hydroxybenzoate polyprenyltransferase
VKLINRFIDLILYTSLFTACCATGLCMVTEKLINTASPQLVSHLHILVFGSSLVVYNTAHIIRWQRNVAGLRPWYFLFFGAGAAMVITSLFWLPMQILVACIILAAFTFAYSWPLLPFKNKKRLREYGWLKIAVLAGVWTIVTSILPVLYYAKNISDYPYEILLRFVFIFTLCIVFDIRDMKTDLEHNIYTLPHKVGLKNSYRLIDITLLLFSVLSVLQYFRYPDAGRLAGALLTAIVAKLVVIYLGKHHSNRAYLGLADGVMMVYALLVLLR